MIRILAFVAALLCVVPAVAQPLPANLDKANAIVIDSTKGRIVIKLRNGTGRLGFGDFARWSPAQAQRLMLIATLIVFVAVIPWLGTTLGLFAVMLATMWILGVRAPATLLGVAFGVSATVYLVFIVVLGARFPAGPIEHGLAPLFGGGV